MSGFRSDTHQREWKDGVPQRRDQIEVESYKQRIKMISQSEVMQ